MSPPDLRVVLFEGLPGRAGAELRFRAHSPEPSTAWLSPLLLALLLLGDARRPVLLLLALLLRRDRLALAASRRRGGDLRDRGHLRVGERRRAAGGTGVVDGMRGEGRRRVVGDAHADPGGGEFLGHLCARLRATAVPTGEDMDEREGLRRPDQERVVRVRPGRRV